MTIFSNKTIIIFGGTGSIGSEIAKELIKHKPKQLRIFARDETRHEELLRDINYPPNVRSLIGDVRDAERVRFAMRGVDIVFNAAALKAVPYCEYNPAEAVYTNVIGTQNIIHASIIENVERVVVISTDKAAEPVNTLGATKLLAERITSAADFFKGKNNTIFTSVRFGNVLGSRNSVLPTIKHQILNKLPITVTDPKMVRFIMSIPEAVKLVLKAATISKGGDVFVLKMPIVNIADLIDVYSELVCNKYNVNKKKLKIKITNQRPGDKYNEKLLSEYELNSCYENHELYLLSSRINKPNEVTKEKKYKGFKKLKEWSNTDSAKMKVINKKEIKEILENANLI